MEVSAPIPIQPQPANITRKNHDLPPLTKPDKTPIGKLKEQSHVQLDTYSPVQQNGSFAFDRVIKSRQVLKRTRKTKSWKPVFLVLRPNQLSIYKDAEATKLRHQLAASDLTAVARQKDPKRKAKPVFGVFSPSRNFHFEADDEKDAQEWVELIRQEARIDELEEDEMSILSSPANDRSEGLVDKIFKHGNHERTNTMSSSSEQESSSRLPFRHAKASEPGKRMHSQTRRPSKALHEYSGNDAGSYSDFSDTGFFPGSTVSLSQPKPSIAVQSPPESQSSAADAVYNPTPQSRPGIVRSASGLSMSGAAGSGHSDEERVIYHGYIYLLKSKNGIRQWKTLWCVLRPKSLAMYKDESEYTALLLLPFPNIINAVEIDAQSKTKTHCFQIITEERNYRFCAMSENELAKWLGAFKSLLARRKEKTAKEQDEAQLRELDEKGKEKAAALSARGKGLSPVETKNVSFSSEATTLGDVGGAKPQ